MSTDEPAWKFDKKDQIIQFENKPIEMCFFEREPSVPWFKGKSVTEALDYTNTTQALITHVNNDSKKSLRLLIETYGGLVRRNLWEEVVNIAI